KQDEIFHDTIEDVADITSATSPDFSEVNEWKRKSVEKIKELDEDLVSFTSTDDEIDVKETMNQIETVMNNAKTSEGKARFADFKGASDNSELKKLMEYNDGKQEEKNAEIEEAKDVRDNALQSDIESSSKEIANILYKKFENGDITFDQYMIMMDTAKALPYIKEPTKFYNQVMKQVIDNASDISVTEGISSGLENGGEYTKDIIKEIRYHAAKWGPNEKNSFVMYSSDSAEKSSKFIKGADIFSKIGKYGVPLVGGVVDFGVQKARGEDTGDAAVKATAHIGIGIAGAAVGGAIGSAIPIGGTIVGGAIGFAAGVALSAVGNTVFDFAYDNREQIIDTVKHASGAVNDFISGLGTVFD